MTEQQETYSDPFMEETALVYLLKDLHVFQDQKNSIDPNIFDSRKYRALWDAAVSYYDKYQGIIDIRSLEVMLDEANVPVEKKADYLLLFNSLKSKTAEKSQYLMALDILKNFQKKRRLFDLAKHISAALKNDKYSMDELTKEIANKVLGLDSIQETVFRESSLPETWEGRISEYLDREKNPEKYKGIPFGIKSLDDVTSGIFPEELCIIFGGPATGKSRSLASIAYNMYKSGRNVMYITVEMPGSQVARLFDARDYMISSSGLRKGKLSPSDKDKYSRKKTRTSEGDFHVVDVPEGCSSLALIPIIRKYKARKKLDAIIIDYLNLLESSDKSSYQNEALKIGTIGKELKRLARLERVAVLTATTAKSDAMKFEDVLEADSSHVGWSFLLSYQADLILFLKKMDPADLLSKKLDIGIIKYRDGHGGKLSLGVDFDKCFIGDMRELLIQSGAIAELQKPQGVPA